MPIEADIVVVTYNSEGVLRENLAGLAALPETRLIIVDNASSDGSVRIARSHADILVENLRNKGFGSACNQGAAEGTAEYLLFVNPDARLNPSALKALLSMARQRPAAAAFNPVFLDPDGKPFLRGACLRSDASLARIGGSTREIDVLSGATFLCRRTAFQEIGGFDERIFLFFEDDDLSIRLRRAGWQLFQVGDAKVEHLVGRSSPTKFSTRLLKERAYAQAELYVSAKHGVSISRTSRIGRAMRRLLLACLLFDRERISRNLGRLQGYIAGPT
ncbi:MAG: glycosyltransferase family 2 protein [Pseudomonadota bacterium]